MFVQTKKFIPYDRNLKKNARALRKNMTAAERKIWYGFLRGYRYRFVRQKVIANYILDFYCQKVKLGIEIGGETHLGNRNEEYDKTRTEKLAEFGIEIIRFWNYEILSNLEQVVEIIKKKISKIEKIFLI